jgi:hypothetical protein
MRITTTDPTTGNEVHDTANVPFVAEGRGDDAIKIFFESEASRQEYLEFSAESAKPDPGVVGAYNQTKDNETTGTIT